MTEVSDEKWKQLQALAGLAPEYVNAFDWPGEQCWHCKRLTTLVEIDFQARLCSDQCVMAKTDEFFAAATEDFGPTCRVCFKEVYYLWPR